MFFDGKPHPVWEKIPVALVGRRYDIGEMSFGSVHLEDLFGEEPEYFFVRQGDVAVEGGLTLEDEWDDEIGTVYVIEGDLTVSGLLSLQNSDSNTSLYVTGSVAAQDLMSEGHGQLFVGGSLVVKSLLVTDLADAGHLVVHGSVSFGTWIEIAGRGAIYFNEEPAGRCIGDCRNPYFGENSNPEPAAQAVLPEFFDDHHHVDHGRIRKAILEGKRVLV